MTVAEMFVLAVRKGARVVMGLDDTGRVGIEVYDGESCFELDMTERRPQKLCEAELEDMAHRLERFLFKDN